jgi:hypothetical protein
MKKKLKIGEINKIQLEKDKSFIRLFLFGESVIKCPDKNETSKIV